MKHISVRVPWHDNGWNSHVCVNPCCNTFCKQLPNIVNSKVDCEQLPCGIDWSQLPTKERPACAGENGGFMNRKVYEREFVHIYAWNPENPHSRIPGSYPPPFPVPVGSPVCAIKPLITL